MTKRGKTSVTNLRSSWDTIIHGAGSYPHLSQHSRRVPRQRCANLIQTQILCEEHGALDYSVCMKRTPLLRVALSSQPASISCYDASVNCLRSFAQTGGAAPALPEAGLRSPNQAHSRGSVLECKSLCFNHIRLSSHLAHLLVLCFQDFSACAKLLHQRQRQG